MTTNERELGLLAALARYENLNSRMTALLAHFGSAAGIFAASAKELSATGIKAATAWEFVAARTKLNPEAELAAAAKHKMTLVPFGDANYPLALAAIHNPPALLFVRGNVATLRTTPAIACVGTRKISSYGAAVIKIIVEPLAEAGANIVSGLALGCDAACHEAALNAHATTVAVLGSGIDPESIGPRSNARLAERIIASGGALVSEYPPGTPGYKNHFPERNRIIAGLAQATLVIEAAERSGSLITAFQALDSGRDVFTVPGPITSPASAGCNRLIARGATPALSADDLIKHLGLETRAKKTTGAPTGNPTESVILKALTRGPLDTDTLLARTNLSAGELFSALTALEISGQIIKMGDNYALK